MRVVTFYSYKGGVGRTLACANFGLYLAKTGQNVVLADMDFEAPGLDAKFPSVTPAQLSTGMLDQFDAFQNGREIPELQAIEIPLPADLARSGGRLRFIPAGNYLDPGYYKRLAGLRWDTFLGEEDGLAFCIDLPARIERDFGADVLVVDSRTGLTEVGGLCTQVLPDVVVLFTSTSPESLSGTKRIHDRVTSSPIVKKRIGGRDSVDARIVVTRVPRPESLPAFDETMKKRLGLEVDRLYYLFEQRDLSLEEYLALDRFGADYPEILDDYVELFASFHPETTLPYVEKRLDDFRLDLTRRAPQENERLIQELATLFPCPEVLLEAAHYYRLTRGKEARTLDAYIRYLGQRGSDQEALGEFAQVCESLPRAELKPEKEVARLLRVFGMERMTAKLLERYVALVNDEETFRRAVEVIVGDEAKFQIPRFREICFRLLRRLEEWEDIVRTASEKDPRNASIGLVIAEAHVALGHAGEALNVLEATAFDDLDDLRPHGVPRLLYLLYQLMPDDGDVKESLRLLPGSLTRSLSVSHAFRFGHVAHDIEKAMADSSFPQLVSREKRAGFLAWVRRLEREFG